jgi:hypothetical protein
MRKLWGWSEVGPWLKICPLDIWWPHRMNQTTIDSKWPGMVQPPFSFFYSISGLVLEHRRAVQMICPVFNGWAIRKPDTNLSRIQMFLVLRGPAVTYLLHRRLFLAANKLSNKFCWMWANIFQKKSLASILFYPFSTLLNFVWSHLENYQVLVQEFVIPQIFYD